MTREEFIKLLIEAFYSVDYSAKTTFTDIPDDSWCYSYVASAEKYGITKGKGNSLFGLGELISRQDMAVMAHRAVSATGRNLEKRQEKLSFSDDNIISTYAVEAIESMQEAGIINGMGDGNFAPFDNANRAQAATIIYKLMAELVGGAQY